MTKPLVGPLRLLALLLPTAHAALLLDEDFSCAMMGCAGHHISNLSYWRHSTTGGKQGYLTIGPATGGRSGNEVNFSVTYCRPPNPNPEHLGCYRSELALQRDVQDTLIDWKAGEGSSQRCQSTPPLPTPRCSPPFSPSISYPFAADCRQGLASQTGCWTSAGKAPPLTTASTAPPSSCMARTSSRVGTAATLC